MFKLTLLTISVAMFNVASSQTRVATDNRRLDSLTKFFNTYSINLIVNDTVVKVAAIYEVNKELRKEFAFLKLKRLKHGTADFEIKININGQVIGPLQYTVSSNTTNSGTYTKHTFGLDHLVNVSLAFYSNGAHLSSINLDSGAVVKRTYSYTETISDYKWANEYDAMRLKQADRQNAEKGRRNADEIWRFEKDFFDVFTNYKNSKL